MNSVIEFCKSVALFLSEVTGLSLPEIKHGLYILGITLAVLYVIVKLTNSKKNRRQ